MKIPWKGFGYREVEQGIKNLSQYFLTKGLVLQSLKSTESQTYSTVHILRILLEVAYQLSGGGVGMGW